MWSRLLYLLFHAALAIQGPTEDVLLNPDLLAHIHDYLPLTDAAHVHATSKDVYAIQDQAMTRTFFQHHRRHRVTMKTLLKARAIGWTDAQYTSYLASITHPRRLQHLFQWACLIGHNPLFQHLLRDPRVDPTANHNACWYGATANGHGSLVDAL